MYAQQQDGRILQLKCYSSGRKGLTSADKLKPSLPQVCRLIIRVNLGLMFLFAQSDLEEDCEGCSFERVGFDRVTVPVFPVNTYDYTRIGEIVQLILKNTDLRAFTYVSE